MLPYLEKRMLSSSSMPDFKTLITNKYNDVEAIVCETLRKDIEDMQVGCFVVQFHMGNDNVEPLVCHRFQKNMSVMIAKESLFSLQMRYLKPAERTSLEQYQAKD